ncbi:Bug family tripartite tricarboxylate transporter substrate binding protein [Sabulicella glaciei]|uniref:Tripartite tricarboxylate transporter substrate binding protein n=1 Tax=Sabulicella glaciei TaxID=2984948 RepID=A0ABT3NTV4_9PROT|nr:tripartite tricarboxylate transporter substrate binding protein [Roseococcus sp. MDT2-1-1]MCW8085580.1 tripartite tricarboxylate transporter substrate binding protein [Roseococcus sp. MDT2-1-1]
MHIRRRAMLAAPAVLLPGRAWGQEWPSRPIRIVSTFEPGGAADQLARGIAALMGPHLGQTVLVENRTGASGNIGTDSVARSTDGHTVLLASTGPMIYHQVLFRSLSYDAQRQLRPIGFVAHSPNIFATRSDSGWTTIGDVVAAARARPDELTYGSAGIGTTQHLVGEMLQAMAGIRMTHIPYRGGAPALQDMLGGRLSLLVTTGSGASTVREGRLNAVGVTGATRIPVLPNVPTMVEQGFPGFVATAWYGLVAPASMPDAAVQRLNEALRLALTNEDFVARMRDQTLQVQATTIDEFARFMDAEREKWVPVTRNFTGSM